MSISIEFGQDGNIDLGNDLVVSRQKDHGRDEFNVFVQVPISRMTLLSNGKTIGQHHVFAALADPVLGPFQLLVEHLQATVFLLSQCRVALA